MNTNHVIYSSCLVKIILFNISFAKFGMQKHNKKIASTNAYFSEVWIIVFDASHQYAFSLHLVNILSSCIVYRIRNYSWDSKPHVLVNPSHLWINEYEEGTIDMHNECVKNVVMSSTEGNYLNKFSSSIEL